MGNYESVQLKEEVSELVLSGALVSHLRERFESVSDSLGLNREEVNLIYKAKPRQLELIFSLFDSQSRGRVDAFEFMSGMVLISEASLESKAEMLFDLFDFDHSQSITFDELIILMRSAANSLAYMCGAPLLTLQQLEDHTDKFFSRIDSNHDNSLSLIEFIRFVNTDTQATKLLERLHLSSADDRHLNFGTEDDPEVDLDLEAELMRDCKRTEVQERAKQGLETLDDTPFLLESVGEGDQFMAVKPWEGVVRNSVPTGYKRKKGDDDPPDASLELEYVHGYRCHDVRDNLRYNADGKVVYHTAAIGVVLDPERNTQQHLFAHTDDIIAFAVSPDLRLAVTGEVGRTPLMCVWNTSTLEVVRTFQGLLKKGIKQVCFSGDSSRVAGLSAEDLATVVVYDLSRQATRPGATQSVVASGNPGRDQFLDMKFHPSSADTLVLCGVRVLLVCTIEGGQLKAKRGVGWNKSPNTQQQALLSLNFLGAAAVTGAFNGCIFKWNGGNLGEAVKVHESAVTCISRREAAEGLVTGGNDGFVYILDATLNKVKTFDLKTFGSAMPKPRSVFEGRTGALLIGSRGGEIYEVKGTQQPRVLLKGHFDLELWGVTAHPVRAEYASVGQDCLLAIWDIATRKQKVGVKLQNPATTLTYSQDGSLLAVGQENGQTNFFDANSLRQAHSIVEQRGAITIIKYSPDGSVVAVGAKDSNIFTYLVRENYRLQYRLRGHHSSVTHMDFSVSGDVIISNSTSYEVLFHTLSNGKLNPSGASAYRDERWAKWTLTFGWPVQGIWPPCTSGDDINAIERSKSQKVIATVDDFGKVKLFKYPCVNKGAGFVDYRGHSSHVTNLSFLNGYLISTGGNDKAIFQWKYTEEAEAPPVSDEIVAAVTEDAGLFTFETAGQGDQFMAVKPWLGEVINSAPSGYTAPRSQGTAPDHDMTLKRVHGYRSFDSRQNLFYTADGRVVYPAAALGIVLDPRTRQQSFYRQHDDDVVSLAIHPQRKIVATGQMAHIGKSKAIEIFVWDCTTLETIACLKGFHIRAIRQLDFSPDGTMLLSIGEDDDHSVAVYDWAAGRLICTAKVDRDVVLGAVFTERTEMVIFGAKFIKFFSINGQNCTGNRGISGTRAFEAQMCGAKFKGNFITGTHTGNLWIWNGRTVGKTVKAHEGQVWALKATEDSLYSGGSEGKIVIWNATLVRQSEENVVEKSLCPGIRSIDISGSSILVGTRGAEILELKRGSIEALMTGHFNGELWGLALHPTEPFAASCGGDKTVRIWNLEEGTMEMAIKPLTYDMRALDWSKDGRYIVTGLVNGVVMLLDARTLSNLSTHQSSFKGKDCWIQDIKFSPDSSLIAFGAHGGASKVEIVSVTAGKIVKKCVINAGLTSALTHLDWSVDGSLLAVNSQAYELKFVSVAGMRNVASSSTKTVDWASWTCVLGWPVQFIWPPCADGSDINSCVRSANHDVLLTADDWGKVNMFRYPVVVKGQASKSFTGHSSHVTNVRFSSQDRFVVSTGGNDKCVFVWETDFASPTPEPAETDFRLEEEEVPKQKALVKRNEVAREKTKAKVTAAIAANEPDSIFDFEEIGEGDQFMAVKPWIGALKAPSSFVKAARNSKLAPVVNMTLDFIHGYRAKDCRNNLRYLPDGRLIYHAAGVGITMDKQTRTQSFFVQHVDDITAFALKADGSMAATGEVGRRPNIFVWDTASQMLIASFKAPLEKGIAGLAFSPSGNKLAAVAMDDDHSVAIYDINTKVLLSTSKGDRSFIIEIVWVSETELATAGVKHFKSWQFAGSTLTGKLGQFGRYNNALLCAATHGTNVLTGASDGSLIVWSGASPVKAVPLHRRAIDSVWASHSAVVTGAKDGCVHILSPSLQKVHTFDLSAPQFQSLSSFIRSACLNEAGDTLLVGTYGSEIYEVAVPSGENVKLMSGHYTPSRGTTVTNEVWGLAVFPDNSRYVTCSDDGTLRLWDFETKTQLHCVKFAETEEVLDAAKARSLSVNSSATLIAVGFKDGSFKVLETNLWSVKISKKERREEIADLKFSPDDSKLAVGSHDNFIDIYSTRDYKRLGICKGHSSFITHLDWSTDSRYLHSNCGAYELLFWEGETGRQQTSGATALRDEPWASFTLVIGWPVQGIYPQYADGTDVNAVDRSSKKFGNDEYSLVATADDFGLVKLFRHPCLEKGAEAVIGRGHSSHVTNVRFLPSDQRIVSTGGDDQCVFQWKVE
jgi:microtubule-associated protein-like 6